MLELKRVDGGAFVSKLCVVIEPCCGAGWEPGTRDVGERVEEDAVDGSDERGKDKEWWDEVSRMRA